MLVCCMCGKNTLNAYFSGKKVYCKNCVKETEKNQGATLFNKISSDLNHNDENPVFVFKGNTEKIELYCDRIVFKRGMMDVNGKNQKEVFLSSIMSINIKKPLLSSGYIQFVIPGSVQTKLNDPFMMDAIKDDNTILFNGPAKYAEALALKYGIEKYKRETQSQAIYVQQNQSIADELIKLKSLLVNGIITQEEFEKLKTKLLNS